MSRNRARIRPRSRWGTGLCVVAGAAAFVAMAPPQAIASTDAPAGAEASTHLECETRRNLREIDRRHFVIEPVVRCARVVVEAPELRVDRVANASRLPVRIGRGRSIHQSVEHAEIDVEHAVRWSEDRSLLSNAQAERSRRAMRGRFVRR